MDLVSVGQDGQVLGWTLPKEESNETQLTCAFIGKGHEGSIDALSISHDDCYVRTVDLFTGIQSN